MTRVVRLAYGPSRLGGPSRLARLEGRLTVADDGCVFAAFPEEGTGSALAWPLDYSARVGADDLVEIVDDQGEVVLREGDAFTAAGGLGPDTPEAKHAREVHGLETFFIVLPVERLPR